LGLRTSGTLQLKGWTIAVPAPRRGCSLGSFGSEIGRLVRDKDFVYRTEGREMEQTTPEAADGLGLVLRTAASRDDMWALCSRKWRRLVGMVDNSDRKAPARILPSMRFSRSVILVSCASREVYKESTLSLRGVVWECTPDKDVTLAWNKLALTPTQC
jgi:hypothetical protein